MKLAEQVIKKISEMAFHRDKWESRVRDAFLGGALGEYAKVVISKKIGKEDFWSSEVISLLIKVHEFMDTKAIKTKQKFKRDIALRSAISDASTFQDQITNAKKELSSIYPKSFKKIYSIELNSKDLMNDMLSEFFDLAKKKYEDEISRKSN